MRLDKFAREATRKSLVEVRGAIEGGRLTWPEHPQGKVHFDGSELVFPEDVILWEGAKLERPNQHTTLVFNKPKSVTSTLRDPRGKRDLSAYMKEMPEGVFPVGRLDRDTSGALLFTTDGDLASAVLRPDHALDKTYWLWLDESIEPSDERLHRLTEGIEMLGSIGKAEAFHILHRTEDYTELELTLNEGKNRQIRRMCFALKFHLLHLHRKRVGPISVSELALGEFRVLGPGEVDALYAAAGGQQVVRDKQHWALAQQAKMAEPTGTCDPRLSEWLKRHPSPVHS